MNPTTTVATEASAPKIQKLDEVVVNRIAAGEVIQRPANAIKELIENCLDAKSKSIQVTVRSGGLKLLQIQDDGCGIRKEDMPIVCERFTTSKLTSFDDLKSISTYGFRGEALASISHVAHLTITTKTAESPCAYKAKYEDGKMIALQPGGKIEPKPCAGNRGTLITVEDLFYNVAVRRKALKNPNEEQAKIMDVVSKYSIHNPSVAFSLKKFGQNIADVRTPQHSTIVDNIKTIYGPTMARELLEIQHEDEKLSFKLHGYVSNANYSIKKCTLLLFINNRLVESTTLRKALDSVYVNYLPKDKHPFMYISLDVNPLNLDVNVHPTKHEVKFLHEEMIIESIQNCVETKLLGANESRQYYTQTLLPKMVSAGVECPIADVIADKSNSSEDVKRKAYAHELVRTDCREQKMQAFFPRVSKPLPQQNDMTGETNPGEKVRPESVMSKLGSEINESQRKNKQQSVRENEELSNQPPASEDVREYITGDSNIVNTGTVRTDSSMTGTGIGTADMFQPSTSETRSNHRNTRDESSHVKSTRIKKMEKQTRLTSVKDLCKHIDQEEHLSLKNLLKDHKFVGCVNRGLALIQHLTQLYLVNTKKLSQKLFYQILMFRFGNFGYMELSEPAPIFDLVLLALNNPESGWKPSDGDKEELACYVKDLLMSKVEMLLDYFSFEINKNGELTAIPLLLENYIPNWNGLPMLLLRLATEVDWDSEEECFHTFAEELSHFFAFGPDLSSNEDDEDENPNNDAEIEDDKERKWKHVVEHVLYPTFRSSLIPPKEFSTDGTFLEVANLPDLYKVFERC